MKQSHLRATVAIGIVSAFTFLAAGPVYAADSAPPSSPSQGSAQTATIQGVSDNGVTTFNAEGSSLTVLPATGAEPDNMQALAASISCSLNVQNVHPSSHVNGTINGIATVNCTAPAGQLQIAYSLIRLQPYTQWGGPTRTNAGYSSIQTNRAVSCSEGPAQFRGWAQGVIAPPPGYELVGPATTNAYGNITGVACGVSSRSADSQPANMEEISVTLVRSDLN